MNQLPHSPPRGKWSAPPIPLSPDEHRRILEKTRAIVARGWCKYTPKSLNGERCLTKALVEAYHEVRPDTKPPRSKYHDPYWEISSDLVKDPLVKKRITGHDEDCGCDSARLTVFNDRVFTTKKEVLRVLDRAIKHIT